MSKKATLEIHDELKRLSYWPDNERDFVHEKVDGSIKFDFDRVEDKWIRVFAYQEDTPGRKRMWILKVMAKKQNRLTKTDLISLKQAVKRIDDDIREYLKKKGKAQSHPNLSVLSGENDGKD